MSAPRARHELQVSQSDQNHKIRALEDEIARLRIQLEDKDSEITSLKALVDQDMYLPLLNRRAFEREMSRVWSAAKRYAFPVALIYMDLDNMKQINDRFGHEAGDQALQLVADVLRDNCRESDLAGRLGGDEFGLLMMHADEQTADLKAAELAKLVASAPFTAGQGVLTLSLSYGFVAGFGEGSVPTMIKTADRRMYQMKQSGKPE